MINKLLLSEATTLEEAISLLDKNGNGFLPVIEPSGKLYGIITDGDIRKALLRGELDLKNIINAKPIVALNSESKVTIINRLQQLKRNHMPIVDNNGHFVDVVVLNDFTKRQFDNQVVIMAGGLGSRLGDLTKDMPKPMLNVNGKPILHQIIENFKTRGFHNFILCLNYKAEIIQEYFGNGNELNVTIQYTRESKRLGTAGPLSLIDKEKLRVPFLVTNADIITALSFEDLLVAHNNSKGLATMCVKRHTMQLPYANVITDDDGNLVDLEEKPLIPFFINAGIYAFDPEVLKYVPSNEYLDMPTLFHELRSNGLPIKIFKMDDYWIDIGMPHDYKQAFDTTYNFE